MQDASLGGPPASATAGTTSRSRYVWVVGQGGWAYKVDPDTYAAEMASGLNGPYT